MTMETIHCVFAGDPGCGKTTLIGALIMRNFPLEPVRSLHFPTGHISTVKGKRYNFVLIDTKAEDVLYELFSAAYERSDVVIACYDISDKSSLDRLTSRWLPEIRRRSRNLTPIIMLGLKLDIRWNRSPRAPPDFEPVVDMEDAMRLCLDEGLYMTECSTRYSAGFRDIFSMIVKAYKASVSQTACTRFLGLCRKFRKHPVEEEPPIKPPQIPYENKEQLKILVKRSSFRFDVAEIFTQPMVYGFTFVFQDRTRLHAHTNILGSTSQFFQQVIDAVLFRDRSGHVQFEDLEQGKVYGITTAYSRNTELGLEGIVEIFQCVTSQAFSRFLVYMYTGQLCFSNSDDIVMVQIITKVFRIDWLKRYLTRVLDGYTHGGLRLNIPSITREELFNIRAFSNVQFNVQDRRYFCHREILSARCRVMAAMFSGNFVEGRHLRYARVTIHDIEPGTFEAFLEYLYFDQIRLPSVDIIDLMRVADMYNQQRLLNLCELYLFSELRRNKQRYNVFELLNIARNCNAHQLAHICLRVVSEDFPIYRRRFACAEICERDKNYIIDNRTPPLVYEKERRLYREYVTQWAAGVSCCTIL